MTITVSALPTPPSRQDPANFRTRADDFLSALPDFGVDLNSQNLENNQINANINAQVATAVSAAADAVVSAASAAATSTAVDWVSGTTYAIGNIRRSLIDGLPYTRLTSGGGTTDPRNDAANWSLGIFQYDTGTPSIRPTLMIDPCNAGAVDTRLANTRSSTATYWDAFGKIKTSPANTLRIDHDPVNGERLGYLVENSSQNLLLYSSIDGTPLLTQNVSVSPLRYCISFYGTGTITLSGAYSASISGISSVGRTFLTFTPIVGTLTVSVSGDVRYGQLELEAGINKPTSFIPTTSSPVTRSGDVPLITGSNFTNFYNPLEGTFVVDHSALQLFSGASWWVLAVTNSSSSDRMTIQVSGQDIISFTVTGSSTTQAEVTAPVAASDLKRIAVSYKQGQISLSVNGLPVVSTSFGSPPSVDRLRLGGSTGYQLVSRLKYLPRSVTAAELQALSRI